MNPDGPALSLQVKGHSLIILRPSSLFSIGRSKSNDLAITDVTVSRQHAIVKWDREDKYPLICDRNSSAGLRIDGESTKWKHLHGLHWIKLGDTEITATYLSQEADVPTQMDQKFLSSSSAILAELTDSDEVMFFTDYGKEVDRGRLDCSEKIHDFLSELEISNKTGTLHIYGDYNAELTFARGKIKRARCGDQKGLFAVETIYTFPNANYFFSPTFEVGETTLNVSPTSHLRDLRKRTTREVKRPTQRFARLFKNE